MIKRVIFLIVIFYVLTLIQSSFLIHFNIKGVIPNLVLILVFLINFFSAADKPVLGIYAALTGGFFLDIFSNSFLGLSIIIFLIIGFFIKKSLFVLKEKSEKHPFIYFLPILFLSLIFYDLFLNIIFYFQNINLYLDGIRTVPSVGKTSSYFIYYPYFFQFGLSFTALIEIIYNLVLGFLAFYFYKRYYGIFKKI